MKRVVALSDSHGLTGKLRENLLCAFARGKVDAAVFLGDGLAEWETVTEELTSDHPQTAFYAVRGNNDWNRSAPTALCFSVNGVKFFACHGHEWSVKYDYYRLELAARAQGARVALFGHTHVSCLEPGPDCTLINPGAVCEHGGRQPLYAEILVEDDGAIRTNLAFDRG